MEDAAEPEGPEIVVFALQAGAEPCGALLLEELERVARCAVFPVPVDGAGLSAAAWAALEARARDAEVGCLCVYDLSLVQRRTDDPALRAWGLRVQQVRPRTPGASNSCEAPPWTPRY